jgi:hypothetical protein
MTGHITVDGQTVTAEDVRALHTAKYNAVQQAQIQAQEARTQRAIVMEIGRIVGCDRDWEMVGAVKSYVDGLRAEVERLRESFDDLIRNSEGVAGLHLNGDVAPWGDLLEGGNFEEWLLPLSETPAQSLAPIRVDRLLSALSLCRHHASYSVGDSDALSAQLRTIKKIADDAIQQAQPEDKYNE